MQNPGTSLVLMLLTALSLAAAVLAIRRLAHPETRTTYPIYQQSLIAIVALGAGGVFVYRWIFIHGHWQPLSAHVDGLLLIAALFALTIGFIQSRTRLFGLSAFAIPMLSFILAWAVCASAWTYRLFHLQRLDRAWETLHLASVYLGTLCAAIAAIAGIMYLYVQHRLKRKQDLSTLGNLASLEVLESVIIRTATLGFALLTLAMITGIIIVSETPSIMVPGWWYSPKIVLGGAVWIVYALLMNVRYASSFRGARAAWLSIVALVLLIATYGLITAWPRSDAGLAPPQPTPIASSLPQKGGR